MGSRFHRSETAGEVQDEGVGRGDGDGDGHVCHVNAEFGVGLVVQGARLREEGGTPVANLPVGMDSEGDEQRRVELPALGIVLDFVELRDVRGLGREAHVDETTRVHDEDVGAVVGLVGGTHRPRERDPSSVRR